MKKYFKLKYLIYILIAIQFYRPTKNISTEDAPYSILKTEVVPENVAQILKTSCFDCHSNNTVYPWYNNIAPVSWWLNDHITEGKRHLNFDEWGKYSKDKQNHKLRGIKKTTEKHFMPLDSYLWIHKYAKLSDDQIKTLGDWARTLYPDIDKEPVRKGGDRD